jgi:hypothetical protein
MLISSNQPTRAENQKAAREILSESQQKSISIQKGILQQAGRNFIQAAQTDSKAWDVALRFVNYNSANNVVLPQMQAREITKAETVHTHYDNSPVPGKPSITLFTFGGLVVPEDAARFERIGHNKNANIPGGPAGLLIKGGALSIDGYYFKRCVFEGDLPRLFQPVIIENLSISANSLGVR